jgi:cystathionine beta-lyase family protein involved in aluminum resistance
MTAFPFPIHSRVIKAAQAAEDSISEVFSRIEKIEQHNGMKVLKAFIDNKISAAHLSGSSGYGYGDIGRDSLDKVFAQAFGAQDALVRHNIVSGTHALFNRAVRAASPGRAPLVDQRQALRHP